MGVRPKTKDFLIYVLLSGTQGVHQAAYGAPPGAEFEPMYIHMYRKIRASIEKQSAGTGAGLMYGHLHRNGYVHIFVCIKIVKIIEIVYKTIISI